MRDEGPLIALVRDSSRAGSLDAAGWDLLVRQARSAGLLGRLAILLQERGQADRVPPQPAEHLHAGRVVADKHERTMRWEVRCLARALAGLDVPVVLLKGAAYVMADLPPARGRLYADVDLMVPKASLHRVEARLLEQGWESLKLHPYDQRFYRKWMHELPPLIHRGRRTVLDLHHTILPETGRLRPQPEKLLAASRPLGEGPFRVFAPEDLVLHSAAHLFQDGDFAGGLRDLIDQDDLLRHFGREAGFWDRLVPRAKELELSRPLYYALRFTQQLLGTPVPAPVLRAARCGAPDWPVGPLMDALVSRALRPEEFDRPQRLDDLARWMLYFRSHWLRMPPHLLLAHLVRKAFRRWYEEDQ